VHSGVSIKLSLVQGRIELDEIIVRFFFLFFFFFFFF